MTIIAVIDTETSRHPAHKPNRVVEVGVMLWDAVSDALVLEFETLVNPNSVIEQGSSEIHGLNSSDLEGAPTFREVAEWLPHYLDGRIVCGFNVSFDIGVLNYEFERAGSDFRLTQSFCAMRQIPGNNFRTLGDITQELGIEVKNAHSAIGDARATLEVLRDFGLEKVIEDANGEVHEWTSRKSDIRPLTWSRYKAGLLDDFDLRNENALWELDELTPEAQYIGLISSILEDRKITDTEAQKLQRVAGEFGFSLEKTHELRKEYLEILEARALENRTVSHLEVERVSRMASLLGLETSLVPDTPEQAVVFEGALICVTSEKSVFGRLWSYESLSIVIKELNCVPTNELRKSDKVALLLCPETHVRTGKARKAVDWGIPMMSFAEFLEHAVARGIRVEGLDFSRF